MVQFYGVTDGERQDGTPEARGTEGGESIKRRKGRSRSEGLPGVEVTNTSQRDYVGGAYLGVVD